jgi:two-component sensor histidine kinase
MGRFHPLRQTHDLLSQSGWNEAALHDLILSELAPHTAGDHANVRMNGPPVMLKPQAALFLALAIHELATNASKYGALSAPYGRVDVTWAIAGERPSRLELTWSEHDGPQVEQLSQRGFGTELIERGVRFELQGDAKLEVVDGGLSCKIVIPANSRYLTFVSKADIPSLKEAAS